MSPADDITCAAAERLIGAVVGRTAPSLTKKTYALSLQAYTDELRVILEPVQQYCNNYPSVQKELADAIANTLLHAILEDLKPLSRLEYAVRQDAYLMFVVTQFSPALLKLNFSIGRILCESLQHAWLMAWPKQHYQIVTEEMISAGFDKKWYQCYITQSTCEFLGKPDDCFELKAFRDFRDGYLKSCTDGPALIEEYYKTAPAIVQRITFSHSRNDIFQRIWEQYLQPCLDDLLHSRWEDCKNRYIGMVYALQLEFLPNGNILQPPEFDKQNQ